MNRLIPVVAGLAIAAAVVPVGASDTDGTVQQISPDRSSFTLENGVRYSLSPGVSLSDLRAGDEVSVSYEMKDGNHVATSIRDDQEQVPGD